MTREPRKGECDCCGGAHWSCECIEQPAYERGRAAALADAVATAEAELQEHGDPDRMLAAIKELENR